MKIVTCVAPVNIAVIKYWGKRDEELILPINDSISGTLSLDHMSSKTTIMLSPKFEQNRFWLNGKEESWTNPRLHNCLKEIRKRIEGQSTDTSWNIHICSENNFPTAAGLASSAAGYACLISALAALYDIQGDVSDLARRGSGSACRSVYGGWVHWSMGANSDGSDSIAMQIVPASYWPEIRVLVLVVNGARKKCSSTEGMRRGVVTSQLLQYRAEKIVPERIKKMTAALKSRDFNTFARLTMKDSNQFHAVCLDTYPPCVYMNDVSHAIVDLVHSYNNVKGEEQVAYTFDAGPNACLYTLEKNVGEIMALINAKFPTTSDPAKYFKGMTFVNEDISEDLKKCVQRPLEKDSLNYIIHTKIGDGPKILKDDSEHLLNENGFPKTNC